MTSLFFGHLDPYITVKTVAVFKNIFFCMRWSHNPPNAHQFGPSYVNFIVNLPLLSVFWYYRARVGKVNVIGNFGFVFNSTYWTKFWYLSSVFFPLSIATITPITGPFNIIFEYLFPLQPVQLQFIFMGICTSCYNLYLCYLSASEWQLISYPIHHNYYHLLLNCLGSAMLNEGLFLTICWCMVTIFLAQCTLCCCSLWLFKVDQIMFDFVS